MKNWTAVLVLIAVGWSVYFVREKMIEEERKAEFRERLQAMREKWAREAEQANKGESP